MSKQKIIQAALREFGTHGYEKSTVNAICSQSMISKGLLYHNFSGKDQLYLACVENCFSDLINYMQSDRTQMDLPRYLKRRLQYFTENPLCARIFFEALLQPPKELTCEIGKIKKEFETFNRNIYRTALSHLKLRQGITEQDALEYYEIIQETFNCYFSSPSYFGREIRSVIAEHESKLEKMLDFMFYGIVEREETK